MPKFPSSSRNGLTPLEAAERRALLRAEAEAAWSEYLGEPERQRQKTERLRAARLARDAASPLKEKLTADR